MAMQETPRYQRLNPGALAVAFAVLALLGSFTMGMPFLMMGAPMMWGISGQVSHPPMGIGFALLGALWLIAIGALGGAVTAWVYNAVIGRAHT